MTFQPLVSVIIPAYNSAHFLKESIDSVLSQTYKNYEIIIVDDGSTDNTKDVLSPYIEQKKIMYIYQENKKQAAARNNGISRSKGELIAFIDADDVWLPNKLELQVPLFMNSEIGLVYGNGVLCNENEIIPHYHEAEFIGGNVFNKLIVYGNFIWTSTVIIRKECIAKSGLFKDSKEIFVSEDYHLWLRISYYYDVDFVRDVVVKYRISDGSSSQDKHLMMRKEIVVKKDIMQMFSIPRKVQKDSFYMIYFRISYFLIDENKFLEAFTYLLKMFKYKPFESKNYKLLVKILVRGLFKTTRQ